MSLLAVGTPHNIKIAGVNPTALRMVESDVFNICQRLEEIHQSLYVVVHPDHERPFVVMEVCTDGNHRMVKRYERLDAEILTDVQRMLNVPFEQRFREEVKRIDEHDRKREENQFETETHERFTWEFRRALEDANMVDFMWTKNMPLSKRRRRDG